MSFGSATMPYSVIMPDMRACGVTSNAGLYTETSVGAVSTPSSPPKRRISSGARSSITISSALACSSKVERGAAI